jgi:hypothetical protein
MYLFNIHCTIFLQGTAHIIVTLTVTVYVHILNEW